MSQVGTIDLGRSVQSRPRKSAARRRVVALTTAFAVHGVALGMLAFQPRPPAPPPEPIIEVSLIRAFSTSAPPPTPAQAAPPPPPPERRVLNTPPLQTSPIVPPPPVAVEPTRLISVSSTVAAPSSAAPAPTPGPPAPQGGEAGPSTVTPPSFTAAYLNNPGPQYPMAARRKREQGVVNLRVLVSAVGAAEQVLLERSSGHPDLDAAAVDVVKKRWRFAPAKQGDQTVAAWVLVPIAFELKG
jgi:protein TonB